MSQKKTKSVKSSFVDLVDCSHVSASVVPGCFQNFDEAHVLTFDICVSRLLSHRLTDCPSLSEAGLTQAARDI